MIRVNPRAHRHEDRACDPLDGLVNLFDLGIVLAVGFLLAALSSLNLEQAITDRGLAPPEDQITAPQDAEVDDVPPAGEKVVGRGEKVGTVYRLEDGRLVYVVPR
ncbi:hypothetical protein GCM10027062_27920 [Nocardioides hungaricus]